MKQIRIDDELHCALVQHAQKVRRSLTSEASMAIAMLCDGLLFTHVFLRSEDGDLVVTLSSEGGPDIEVLRDRGSASEDVIVSHAARIKIAGGKVPLEPRTLDGLQANLRERGYDQADLVGQVARLMGDFDALQSLATRQ